MFIIILLTLLIVLLKGFHFIYLFQIKEYRFDRLISAVKEQRVLKTFYFSRIRLPARSIRNIFICLFLIICDITLLLFAIEERTVYIALTVLFLFSPFLAFLLVAWVVQMTEIPVQIYRNLLIMRAYLKVKNSKTIFIGITGSYGKTSVKEYIAYILEEKFKVAKTQKNMNTSVGVAISILKQLNSKTEIFIAEFGAYRRGEIHTASWYIPLKYAVLTGLGNQHLDLYGSRDLLIHEESSLLFKLSEDGIGYVNDTIPDKENIMKKIKAEKITYGLKNTNIQAHVLSSHTNYHKAQIQYREHSFVIETHLLGEHSVVNLLPAIAIALDLGMTPHEIISRISSLHPLEGKLSIHHGKAKTTIINDAVNSNVEGFIAAIRVLHTFPQKTKYIASQGIIELGVEKRTSYQKVLEELYKTDAKLFTTDSLFQELDTQNRVVTFNDVLKLQQKLLSLMNKHSVLLVEGKFPAAFLQELLRIEHQDLSEK